MSFLYPTITWQVTIDATNDGFTLDIDGTAEALTIAQGTYWGFLPTGAGNDAASGSLADAFADAILTHSLVSSIFSQIYSYSEANPGASPQFTIVGLSAGIVAASIVWDDAPLELLLGTPGIDIVTGALAIGSTGNMGGLWNGGPLGVINARVDQWVRQVATMSQPAQAATTTNYSVRNFGTETIVQHSCDLVDDAYIRDDRNDGVYPSFTTISKRLAGDINNTLDGLLAAAGAGLVMRIYEATDVYRSVLYTGDYATQSHVTEADGSGFRFATTLRFREVT